MSAVDFLFEGSAPTPGSTSSTSASQLPEWYNEYTRNMLGRAQAVADIPYAAYGGPRVAGFTPTEEAGFGATKEAAGAYKPFLGGAGEALERAGAGPSGLGAAMPFAGAAMQTFPEAAGQYMSPYTENVVNRIADVGLRQLQEKFLPAIGEEFTRAGQFGGSRMGEFGARALRDVQESVLGEQAKALESGYKTAADIFGADVGRAGQLAGVMGQLGGADIERFADLASRYGELGKTALETGLKGAEAITGVGTAERDLQQKNLNLAYQDFLRQQGYPAEQAKFLSGMLSGVRLPEVRIEERTETLPQPGGPSGIEGAVTGAQGIDALIELFNKYFKPGGGTSGTPTAPPK